MLAAVLRCATTVTPVGSVVGISPAQDHRTAVARGLVIPLAEKWNGSQFVEARRGATAPLRAQEDQAGGRKCSDYSAHFLSTNSGFI